MAGGFRPLLLPGLFFLFASHNLSNCPIIKRPLKIERKECIIALSNLPDKPYSSANKSFDSSLVISEGDDSMLKDLVLQLRYLGVMPQVGYVEYGFRIENKDKSFRQVVLTIEDGFFLKNDLKLQEAPDLCYQKVLMDLNVEEADSRIPFRVPVTALDIAHYRDLHPTAKFRKFSRRDVRNT